MRTLIRAHYSPLDLYTRLSGKPRHMRSPFPAPAHPVRAGGGGKVKYHHRAPGRHHTLLEILFILHALIRELNSPASVRHLLTPFYCSETPVVERGWGQRVHTAPGIPSCRWRRLSLAPGVLPRDREGPARAQGHWGAHRATGGARALLHMRKLACGAEAWHEASP